MGSDQRRPYTDIITQNGGVANLKVLQHSLHDGISAKARSVLDSYFSPAAAEGDAMEEN